MNHSAMLKEQTRSTGGCCGRQRAELEDSLAKLEEERQSVEADVARRQKQFRALWRALSDLEDLLGSEEAAAGAEGGGAGRVAMEDEEHEAGS